MEQLILRQAAIDAIEFGITYAKVFNKETGEVKELFQESNDELRKAVERIKQLPPIQPRREDGKIGEWIYDWGDWDFETCKCSECGNHITTPIGERYSFCPNCGAKMEAPE